MNTTRQEVEQWINMSNQEIRLKVGEMTNADIRLVRAILDSILRNSEDKVYTLCKEFIGLLDIEEVSDSGREFRPNFISSCRVDDGAKMEQILDEIKKQLP